MATNLRLSPETEAALRARSERTGVSQQQLMRTAIDRFLGLGTTAGAARESVADWIQRGIMKPATPFRSELPPIALPEGVTSLDLLERDDRAL